MMNVLLIGSGGREHALAWKIAQSPRLTKLYIALGSVGTAACGENVPLDVNDRAMVIHFCKEKQIDFVLVGPEAPLAAGLADLLLASGIRCFGPTRAAAQIEASKVFAKNFMTRHNIPTACYATFKEFDDAVAYVENVDYPVVIKVSGLAAGKGVILPETLSEARATLESILVNKVFGEAGNEVVIEERLSGEEVSLMAFTDGETIMPMLPAQDHKRLLDGDNGPNTGGMGAYAPAPIFNTDLMNDVLESVLKPAVRGLQMEGTPFVGVLYAGLILTSNGLRVLEFNCRFGDPETQAVLPLLETDLLEITEACVNGNLNDVNINKISFDGLQYRNDIAYRALFPPEEEDLETEKRISDGRAKYRASKIISLPTDQLTYIVNGLAMQVHNELGAGHAEKFYQRRLEELCRRAGIPVETEKRVEVWIDGKSIG